MTSKDKAGQAAALPLAPDRAALSNRISMLLASRSSVLKTMTAPAPSTSVKPNTTAAATARREKALKRLEAEDQELQVLRRGAAPGSSYGWFNAANEGVGYVPDSKAATGASSMSVKEQRMLRVGSGKGDGGAAKKRRVVEEEEDEDEGRSGLGKQKKRRREVVEEIQDNDGAEENDVQGKQEGIAEDLIVSAQAGNSSKPRDATVGAEDAASSKSRRKKSKKKKNKGSTTNVS